MTARRLVGTLVLVLVLLAGFSPALAQSQMTWAVHISLAPTWFDPGEHTGIITIMKVLYALHDALVKPMPGNAMAPSLAESWTVSRDGLAYEFVLRKGVVFHNGDAFSAEDVKFSFDRDKGAAAKLLKDLSATQWLEFGPLQWNPNGFDAGEYTCDASYASVAEAIGNYLGAVGIRTKLRPMERVAYLGQWREKKLPGLHQAGAGGQGNAATRVQNYFAKDGLYTWGSHPDIEDLYLQQARELDPKRREALRHQIQRLGHERVVHAPLRELGFLNAVGPRVEESGLGLIAYHPYSAPYEDLKVKK